MPSIWVFVIGTNLLVGALAGSWFNLVAGGVLAAVYCFTDGA